MGQNFVISYLRVECAISQLSDLVAMYLIVTNSTAHKQSTVIISTMEAEYILSDVLHEVIARYQLYHELKISFRLMKEIVIPI